MPDLRSPEARTQGRTVRAHGRLTPTNWRGVRHALETLRVLGWAIEVLDQPEIRPLAPPSISEVHRA
jgi:hypothetical protein